MGCLSGGLCGKRVANQAITARRTKKNWMASAEGAINLGMEVALEGVLRRKQRGTLNLSGWTVQYFVASDEYEALFWWDGAEEFLNLDMSKWREIERVAFSELRCLRWQPNSIDGRRFDIRLASGELLCLMAANSDEAFR